jgi:arylsulfatase A-like enzyme
MHSSLPPRTAAVLLLVILVTAGAAPAATERPPNVVLIISDDQGWTDYGFMGHPHIATPHLDRLAAEGLAFTRGYVPSSLCRPSLASIITGLHPYQHRLVGNDPPPPPDLVGEPMGRVRQDPRYLEIRNRFIEHIDRVPTLPRMLADRGYLSHQSGKWWEGHYRRGGFTHGMTHGDRTRGGRHGDEGLAIGRKGMEPIFQFIETAVEAERPFFVWYAPFLPHTPHTPPERLLDRYIEVAPSENVARYWAMCEWFDETCGALLDFLDARGLAGETMVLFVCDNGWNEPENPADYLDGGVGGPGAKRSPYDLGLRTPIIVRWPGRVAPRLDGSTPVSSIDLAPTVLAATRLAPTAEMQGLDLLDAEALARREAVFGDVYEHDVQDMDDPLASLRYRWVVRGGWKLIVPHPPRVPDGVVELFHLEADPHEQANLARHEPARVAELADLIEAWLPVPGVSPARAR